MPFSPGSLRYAREQAGLTATEFAAAIGKSYRTVAAYEAGAVTPPIPVLDRAADVLAVSVTDFLRDREVVA